MKHRRIYDVFLAQVFIWLLFFGAAQATTITYEVEDLSDASLDGIFGDVWQYTYHVSDFDFDADYGFTLFFDEATYGHIQSTPSVVNSQWDLITWDPDPGIPDSGVYDALALVDDADLSDPFVVSFIWLGGPGSAPGAQAFDVYDPVFASVAGAGGASISAAAPIPEPATVLLLGSGLLGLAGFIRRLKAN